MRRERPVTFGPPFPPAAGKNGLWSPFYKDHPMTQVIMMQSGHKQVLGLEGYNVGTGNLLNQQLGCKTGLDAEHDQRPFRRITVHPPNALAFTDGSIVAEQRGFAQIQELGRNRGEIDPSFAEAADTGRRSFQRSCRAETAPLLR